MKKKVVNHWLAITGIAVFVFLAIASATTPRVVETPPLPVSDHLTGIALAVQLMESRNFGFSHFTTNGVQTEHAVVSFLVGGGPRGYRSAILFDTTNNILDVRFVNTEHLFLNVHGVLVWRNYAGDPLRLRQFRVIRFELLNELHLLAVDSEVAVNNFLGSFVHNQRYLRILSPLGRQAFIDEHLIGRTYRWSLPLVGFAENRNPNFNQRFVARFRVARFGVAREFGRVVFGDDVTVEVFTNDPSLGMVSIGQTVPFHGVLINANINGTHFQLIHE